MKSILTALWLGISLSLIPTAEAHHAWPEKVRVPLTKAFVPIGFDDNDIAQVVVTGTLDTSCLREGTATAEVDTVARTITLHEQDLRYPGLCLSLSVPYHHVVDIGLLPPGDYVIFDGLTGRRLGQLPVTKARSSPDSALVPGVDDDFYALVTDAFLYRQSSDHSLMLVLDIRLPVGSHMKTMKVSYSADAIIVQPIAEFASPMAFRDQYLPSRLRIPLRSGLQGTVLLHVRSMSGRAVNKLIDLEALLPTPMSGESAPVGNEIPPRVAFVPSQLPPAPATALGTSWQPVCTGNGPKRY